MAESLLAGPGLALAVAAIAFLWRDATIVTVGLEGRGIRRKTKVMIGNPFGTRDRNEYWDYQAITGCGIAPRATLGTSYSVLVIRTVQGMTAFGIPKDVDEQKVAAILTASGLKVQPLDRIPPQAIPTKSVNRKALTRAVVFCAAGVVAVALGGVGRGIVQKWPRSGVEGFKQMMASVAPGAPRRQLEIVGDRGIQRAKLSPDGRWIWGVSKTLGKHFIWNDRQDQPLGEVAVSKSGTPNAAFTPEGRQVVVAANGEAQVWQLEPLKALSKFPLAADPVLVAVAADGKRLVVISVAALMVYEIESGKISGEFKLPPLPMIDCTMAAAGQSVVLVCSSKVLAIRLSDGAIEEVLAFPSPDSVFFSGSLAAGGRWAGMLSPAKGAELFDLTRKHKQASIAVPMLPRDAATRADGLQVAVTYVGGAGVWDVASGKPVVRFDTSQQSLVTSDNGERLVGFGESTPNLTLWEWPK